MFRVAERSTYFFKSYKNKQDNSYELFIKPI